MNGPASSKKQPELTPEAFGQLLIWLAPDRDCAGQKYEQIRRGLIKIFRCRGCVIPEELADRAINRVAAKVQQVANGYVGEPAFYFYSVAEKIYLEYLRSVVSRQSQLPDNLEAGGDVGKDSESKYQCLEECMDRLPPHARELLTSYYDDHQSGRDKIDKRKKLADRMAIGTQKLWLRVHRIREGLKKCITVCLQGKESGFKPS